MVKLIVVDVNKEVEDIKVMSFEQAQHWIEGYIEFHRIPAASAMLCPGYLYMAMNEDGRSKNLPVNPRATVILRQQVVGNVVLVKRITDLKSTQR